MTGNFGVEQSTCHNDAVHTPSPVHANVAESLVLCLVSGSYKLGGFNEALKKVGLGCEVIDFTSDPITDLLDHHVWQTLNCRILKGDFVAVLMSPPCRTFDAANSLLRQASRHSETLRGQAFLAEKAFAQRTSS